MLNAIVLIADQEVESRMVLAELLEKRLQFEAITSAGGQDMIDQLYRDDTAPPEVILMDVASDTTDALKYLQQTRKRFPTLPIVALTNYGDSQQATRAL